MHAHEPPSDAREPDSMTVWLSRLEPPPYYLGQMLGPKFTLLATLPEDIDITVAATGDPELVQRSCRSHPHALIVGVVAAGPRVTTWASLGAGAGTCVVGGGSHSIAAHVRAIAAELPEIGEDPRARRGLDREAAAVALVAGA